LKYIDSLREGIKNCIEDYNVVMLGEDITDPYGGAFKVTKGFSVLYPHRVFSAPMSEQGFTAMGIGCALAGQPVLIEIMFCDFITLIADQIINHATKFRDLFGTRLPFVVRTPTGGYRGYGATHSQCMERLFMGIPGLRVLAPSVLREPGKMLESAIVSGIPTLFVENKLDYFRNLIDMDSEHTVFSYRKDDYLDEVNIKGEKPAATIITYGGLVPTCMEVLSKLFLQDEIALQLLVIKDLNGSMDAVCPAVTSSRILFIEEGWEQYGVGSEYVIALLQKGLYAEKLGALPHPVFSGKQLENSVLPDEQSIITRIRKLLKK
jgi:pyruvate/2-oxoglutarate/acetoin dehydrogenase E1 component